MGAKIITDPRLLPFYMTLEETASLVRRSERSVQDYCHAGVWRRGKEWIKPAGGPRLYLRDAILKWMESERPDVEKLIQARRRKPVCRGDLSRSPALAAALEREVN